MNFDAPFFISLINILLLIGLFLWLLIGSPLRNLRGMLSKEEQSAQHTALQAHLQQLTQGNERLERELRTAITSSEQAARLEMGQTLAGLQGHVQQSLSGFQGNLTTQLQSISEGNARRLTALVLVIP